MPFNGTLNIRQLRRKDLPTIMQMEADAFPLDAYTLRMMEESISDDPESFLVAEVDGVIVGYIMGYTRNGTAHISSMAVSKNWRSQGIGRAMLEHVLEYFEDMGSHEAVLEVRPNNEPAIYLYESTGFELHKIIPDYYDSDRSPAHVMKKDLLNRSGKAVDPNPQRRNSHSDH